jgi:hypothetical protein
MGATVLVISMLAVSPAPPAGAAPPADVVDASDPGLRQAKLMDFKTWLIARPGLAASGYVESVNYPATMSTTLLWHGDEALQPALVAEGARRGITVTIQPRRYGLPQLKAAMRAVAARTWNGFAVSGISGLRADYDGITVEGAYPMGPQPPEANLAGLSASATTATGVAVRFEVAAAPVFTSATRDTDTPPLNAGGLMFSPGNSEWCSSGFAIRDIIGKTHTTTARHCKYDDYRAANGTTRYGAGVLRSGDGAARELATSGYFWMFDGAWNDAAGYKKTVTGYGDVSLGDHVCSSGGMSGVHCSINIIDMLYLLDDHLGPTFYSIRGKQLTNGAISAAMGDSGGPVLVTAGSGKVHAVGMAQAGTNDIPGPSGVCPAGSVHTATVCFTDVYFTSMRVIVSTISGATLVTGE